MAEVPDWVMTTIWPRLTRGGMALSANIYRLGAPRFLDGERRVYLQMSRPKLARECSMQPQTLDRAVDDLERGGFLHTHGQKRWDAAKAYSIPVDPPVILGDSSSPKSSPSQVPSQVRKSPKITTPNTVGGGTDPDLQTFLDDLDPTTVRHARAWLSWAAQNDCLDAERFVRTFPVDVLEAETERLQANPPENVRTWWGLLWRRCEMGLRRRELAERWAE